VFNKRKTDEPKPVASALPAVEPQPSASTSETPEDNAPDTHFNPPSFKETPMARSPFAPPPMPATPSNPVSPAAPRSLMPNTPSREAAERRTLVVGRGISVQGTVQDAERLVVEGTVEATMINANELSIAPGGVFKGEVEVDDAEVAGTIDGTLVARATLVVRSTGRVLGTARCRRLQVEDGGQITGRIEMLNDTSAHSPAPASLTDA
jgi:cytoskeletal protein CcmA (bactofilin family)